MHSEHENSKSKFCDKKTVSLFCKSYKDLNVYGHFNLTTESQAVPDETPTTNGQYKYLFRGVGTIVTRSKKKFFQQFFIIFILMVQ